MSNIWHLKCLKCGKPYDIDYADIMAMRVEPTTHTVYSYCNNCRGFQIMKQHPKFRLENCPFCGDEMIYIHELYYNKRGHLMQEKYWMHRDEESKCVLEEMNTPLVIGAGDADPENDFVGEYGELWNKQLSEMRRKEK